MELIEPTLTLRKIILLKTVKGFCCLMQEIKNGIDRTHLKLHCIISDGFFHQTYDRFLNLYRQSAKERYIHILEYCPNILQNITLKELASYLQITPTYLSRIRKEITFEK